MNLGDAKAPYCKRERHFIICRGKGTGRGKTGGRGGKGQSARSGYSRHDYFEGGTMPLVRRLPKRGFSNFQWARKVAEVNLRDLNRFAANETVNPEKLVQAGVVRHGFDWVKILGVGAIDRPLTVAAHRFSSEALDKILKAGGKVEWLAPQPKPDAEAAKPEAPAKTAAQKKVERKARQQARHAQHAAAKAEAKPGKAAKVKGDGKPKGDAKPKGEGKPKGEAKPKGGDKK
ncbi:MAG: 50S ribosomal protein L15 [Planctomycetes bacterium]|nr:50S ribosomal protein L15 [Planctomycetota bacterium]